MRRSQPCCATSTGMFEPMASHRAEQTQPMFWRLNHQINHPTNAASPMPMSTTQPATGIMETLAANTPTPAPMPAAPAPLIGEFVLPSLGASCISVESDENCSSVILLTCA